MKVQTISATVLVLCLIASCAPARTTCPPATGQTQVDDTKLGPEQKVPKPVFQSVHSTTQSTPGEKPLLPLAHPVATKTKPTLSQTRQTLNDLLDKFKSELEHLPEDAPAWAAQWAGRYRGRVLGWGGGETFWLAPKAGLLFHAYSCEGLVDWNFSEITELFDGGLKVRIVDSLYSPKHRVRWQTLYFVKWGDRRYLVPQHLMQDFVDEFNEGGRSRRIMSGIPLKQSAVSGDDRYYRQCPTGKPELPEPWLSTLLDEPIKYTVLAVRDPVAQDIKDEPRRRWAYLDLDKGSKHGVANGMRVEYRVGECTAEVRIQGVTETTCVGVFSSKGTITETLEPPQVGATIENQEIDDLSRLDFLYKTP